MNAKLHKIIFSVFLVLIIQGCWAEESNIVKNGNQSTKQVLPPNEAKEKKENLISKEDLKQFRELFVGTYFPASEGIRDQGELTIAENFLSWRDCNKVPFKIVKHKDESFYIEILGGRFCPYRGENVAFMKIYINKYGDYNIALYRSEKSFINDTNFGGGVLGRSK